MTFYSLITHLNVEIIPPEKKKKAIISQFTYL